MPACVSGEFWLPMAGAYLMNLGPYYSTWPRVCHFYQKCHISNPGGTILTKNVLFPTRVVESESVESHVFSWSRSRFSKLLESESVFQNCWSRESESVFQNCWSQESESEHLLQLPTPVFIT